MFMCSFLLSQISHKNQPLPPFFGGLRRLTLGLRLRLEKRPRADICLAVSRGIHRRHVPDPLESGDLASAGVSVVSLFRDRKSKTHLVNIAPLDQLIEVAARCCVSEFRPDPESLLIRDKLQ